MQDSGLARGGLGGRPHRGTIGIHAAFYMPCTVVRTDGGRGAGDGGGTVTPRVCRSWTGGGTSQGDRGGSVATRWVQKATRRKCLQWGAGVDRGEGRGLMAWAAWRPQDHRELSRARRWPRPLGAGSGEMGKRECGPRQRQL